MGSRPFPLRHHDRLQLSHLARQRMPPKKHLDPPVSSASFLDLKAQLSSVLVPSSSSNPPSCSR